MPPRTIEAFTDDAANAIAPSVFPAASVKVGGVDPLGLRQLNYELMDTVLPGLNNVARHVRPFVVIAWAWRRAGHLAQQRGDTVVAVEEMLDFVDRIEVIFVASQLAGGGTPDLPGKDFLRDLLTDRSIVFDGEDWKKRRATRRNSTALSAAINYGPGIRSLGWVVPHPERRRVMLPSTAAEPALQAFEKRIARLLREDAFSRLGPVSVTKRQLETWAGYFAIDALTEEEKQVGATLLFGVPGTESRHDGVKLMINACAWVGSDTAEPVRAAMAGLPSGFVAPDGLEAAQTAWRRVQVRQLFRLALESLLQWMIVRLEGGPQSMDWIVQRLISESPPPDRRATCEQWIEAVRPASVGPTDLISRIGAALKEPELPALAASIIAGISFSLDESPEPHGGTDRLPLRRAIVEFRAMRNGTISDFLRFVLESWVLAQHTQSSVTRGLGDARAGGKVLLRLKVILGEGGWELAPGATRRNPPAPTADRLETALSLARECDLL